MTTRRILSIATAALVAVLAVSPGAFAKPAFKKVAEVRSPTSLTNAPGSKKVVFVTERRGLIRVIRRGRLLKRPFLDIRSRTVTDWVEQGLLGLAFSPDYRRTGKFYVHFTVKNGDVRIEEFRRNRKKPLVANPGSRRTVLNIPEVAADAGHNGGGLRFLGRYLYISVGDGGNPGDVLNQAQDTESLRGKILRVDSRPDRLAGLKYRVPAGNPFAGGPGKDAIFAYGLRNPHTFSFYRDGDGQRYMLVADVGQERYEEINFLPWGEALGANFGWKIYEGLERYDCEPELCPNGGFGSPPPADPPDLTWPDVVYSHDEGCAVITGPVIRDPAMGALTGRLITGDFCINRLFTWNPDGGSLDGRRRLKAFLPPGKGKHPTLNGFGEDGWGRVYLFSNTGGIYRLFQSNGSARGSEAVSAGRAKETE